MHSMPSMTGCSAGQVSNMDATLNEVPSHGVRPDAIWPRWPPDPHTLSAAAEVVSKQGQHRASGVPARNSGEELSEVVSEVLRRVTDVYLPVPV